MEIPYTELLGWLDYFDRRPVDWRDDDRTLKLLQVQGFKGSGSSIFASLATMAKSQENAAKKAPGQISINNLKTSFLFNKIQGAIGGEKLDFN